MSLQKVADELERSGVMEGEEVKEDILHNPNSEHYDSEASSEVHRDSLIGSIGGLLTGGAAGYGANRYAIDKALDNMDLMARQVPKNYRRALAGMGAAPALVAGTVAGSMLGKNYGENKALSRKGINPKRMFRGDEYDEQAAEKYLDKESQAATSSRPEQFDRSWGDWAADYALPLTIGAAGIAGGAKRTKDYFKKLINKAKNKAGRTGGSGGAGSRHRQPTADEVDKDILNLSGNETTQQEVKQKARKAYKEHHPDLGGDEEKMRYVNEQMDKLEQTEWFDKLSSAFREGFDKEADIELTNKDIAQILFT